MGAGWITALRKILIPAVLALSVAACSAQETSMNPAVVSQLAEHEQGRGLAKLNPAPTRAYDLEVLVQGAPGHFAQIEATAQFDVANEDQCGHINAVSGTAERITSNEVFALERIGDAQLRGTFYLDLMQDEDYYGRGVCQWEPTEVRVSLRATGADGETWFVAGLPRRNIQDGQPRKLYFWKGGYPVSGMADYPDFGSADPSRFAVDKQQELFVITLQARER
jgi:hypothetical protein